MIADDRWTLSLSFLPCLSSSIVREQVPRKLFLREVINCSLFKKCLIVNHQGCPLEPGLLLKLYTSSKEILIPDPFSYPRKFTVCSEPRPRQKANFRSCLQVVIKAVVLFRFTESGSGLRKTTHTPQIWSRVERDPSGFESWLSLWLAMGLWQVTWNL